MPALKCEDLLFIVIAGECHLASTALCFFLQFQFYVNISTKLNQLKINRQKIQNTIASQPAINFLSVFETTFFYSGKIVDSHCVVFSTEPGLQ